VTHTSVAAESLGVFTRDQVEILSARKVEAEWLRLARQRAHGVFAETPMPTTEAEEWRYTDIGRMLRLDAFSFAEEAAPAIVDALPAALRALIAEAGEGARAVQVDASVVLRDLPAELASQGVILMSLEGAAAEHPELVQRYLGSAVTPEEGKFAAMSSAFWSGGFFLYVPGNVRVETPVRLYRWLSGAGTAAFGRLLIVAEAGAEIAIVDELASDAMTSPTLSVSAAEIVAEEGARVTYVAVQRFGAGVSHLSTDRLVAGRDARITTLYATLGGDLSRADAQCRMQAPGAHVDMLGVYIAQGTQHFDNETLQDHIAPHASSNLLFKGRAAGHGSLVFRGLIRVHPKAQRTDAYQTNRNLLLSLARVPTRSPTWRSRRTTCAARMPPRWGSSDEEELFYLLSRGIPRSEAVRLVVFGFFGEVLDQLPLEGVRAELVRAVELKLARRGL
jgi:Fe-S cluster assembly protein SufD